MRWRKTPPLVPIRIRDEIVPKIRNADPLKRWRAERIITHFAHLLPEDQKFTTGDIEMVVKQLGRGKVDLKTALDTLLTSTSPFASDSVLEMDISRPPGWRFVLYVFNFTPRLICYCMREAARIEYGRSVLEKRNTMSLRSKEQVLDLLEQTISEGMQFSQKAKSEVDYQAWVAWKRDLKIRIQAIFGGDSEQSEDISTLIGKIAVDNSGFPSTPQIIDNIIGLLRSYYSQVETLWTDDDLQPEPSKPNMRTAEKSPLVVASNEVFVVHGRDDAVKESVARFLEKLDLKPIILHEQPSRGATIIEKFESNSNVAFAVILLTPDDVGSIKEDPQNLQPRARQNVVLELGYFIAKLGRERTCSLLVDGVEKPSDYSGVVYIPYDAGGAWKNGLARELKAAGLPVDMNKIS